MRDKIAEMITGIAVDVLNDKSVREIDKKYTDQILAIPLTAKFPCKECGGTGVAKDQLAECPHCGNEILLPLEKAKDIIYCRCEEMFEIERSDLIPCPNPHCRNGMVEETLCAVEPCPDAIDQECLAMVGRLACDGPFCNHYNALRNDCEVGAVLEIPLTHGNAGEHRDKTLEWRVM